MKGICASFLGFVAMAAVAQSTLWPPLPRDGFVVGRAATKADVEAGHAVFVAEHGGTIVGKPLGISIPQYAWFNNEGRKVPAIIIQAEQAGQNRFAGARLLDGQLVAGFLSDFQLLGTEAPK